mmetsp:Transcript_15828/g.61847  ORF Transcript_15828/g.61847 Transcript_15828/m.61847 type:complete len:196 (-) Transcript_15828:206-793(-)
MASAGRSLAVLVVMAVLCSLASAQSCDLNGQWKTIVSNSTYDATFDASMVLEFSWTGSFTGEQSLDVSSLFLNCTYTVQFEGTYELDDSDNLSLDSQSCNYYNCGGNCTDLCTSTCNGADFSTNTTVVFDSDCTQFTDDGTVFTKQNDGDSNWWVYTLLAIAALLVVCIVIGLVAVVIVLVVKKQRGDYVVVEDA